MVKHLLSGLLAAALLAGTAAAETIALNPTAPERYVVERGDTLWDISARFLRDPWLWPEIWQVNPAIENPHLIYPGDVVTLTYDKNGRPVLTVSQRGRPTVKLSPQARATRLDEAVPTIPLDAIQQFLKRPRVITKEEYEGAPYVVSFQEQRIVAGSGDKAYVRGLDEKQTPLYSLVRLGEPYRNPGADKDDILGYEAIQVAEVQVEKVGDPATIHLSKSYRESLIGDRLVPFIEEDPVHSYVPHAPEQQVEGHIISVLDGVSRIGQYNIVVLNRGKRDGMEPGHVLQVWQSGETVRDTINPKENGEIVTLPDEKAGLLMVFRTFDRVSYALIMEAEKEMKVYDKVRNPS